MHLPIIASSLTKITGALENASQNATSVATIRNILNISKLNTNPSMQRRCLTRDGGKFKIILCMWYYLGLFAKFPSRGKGEGDGGRGLFRNLANRPK